jgi:hypothetical protein
MVTRTTGSPPGRRVAACVVAVILTAIAATQATAQQSSSESRAAVSDSTLVSALFETGQDDDVAIQLAGLLDADLDSLTDDQLLDLYIVASHDSLLSQTADETRLVAPGSVILQSGYTFTHDRDDLNFTYRTHTFPELLLRYRVTRNAELRVGWAGVTADSVTDNLTGAREQDTFVTDPSVGIRLALNDQRDWIPRTALTVSSPVELKSATSLVSRLNPVTTFSYSWAVGDNWLVSGNSGVALVTDRQDRFTDFQQAVSVDYLCGKRWDVFAEWFALFPDGSSGVGDRHFAGPGVSCAINEHLQIGLSASFGLNEAASDLTTQLRVTWRP